MRELRGPDAPAAGDAAGGPAGGDVLLRAIAAARAEAASLAGELTEARERLRREADEADECRRRRELAERIGDAETARVAARFQRSHEARVQVLGRKIDVLKDERGLALDELDELLEFARREAGGDAG